MSGILNVLVAGKAAAGGGFLPTDLTNLIGWYKADTGVTTSSGNVTAVTDQSPAHNNLFNVGTVPLNATSAYNSHPAFDFAIGNNAALVTGTTVSSGATTLPSSTVLSAFFVCRMNTATAAFGRVASVAVAIDPDYGDTNNIVLLNRDGSNAALGTAYDNVNTDIFSVSTATNHRVGVVINGSALTHYVDGATTTGTLVASLSLLSPTNIIIGNQWAPTIGGAAWDGPILEIVIASSALSPTEATNLDAYFVARLGS